MKMFYIPGYPNQLFLDILPNSRAHYHDGQWECVYHNGPWDDGTTATVPTCLLELSLLGAGKPPV